MIIKAMENVEDVMAGNTGEHKPPSARVFNTHSNLFVNNRRDWSRDGY